MGQNKIVNKLNMHILANASLASRALYTNGQGKQKKSMKSREDFNLKCNSLKPSQDLYEAYSNGNQNL